MNKLFKKIIAEICDEEKIHYKFLSNDFITVMEKDSEIRYLFGYKFALNNHAIGLICDDKFALYSLLKKLEFPIIKHYILYNKDNNNNYAKNNNDWNIVYDLFKKNNNSIVLKPNNGTCGNNVIHVTNEKDILKSLNYLFSNSDSISICPYYDIKNEYRMIILNDKVVLSYKKCKPMVVGDGKKTIKELLLDFNYPYFKNKLNNDDYNKILASDEKFIYDWRFNLSKGAICEDINDDKLSVKLKKLALNIANKINLKFGSIDIIETFNNELYIMEINSGVMIDKFINIQENGYEIAKSIYKDAIKEMFNHKL